MRELDRALEDALARRDLSEAQMADVLGEAVRGEADPVRLGALLVALRMKGESLSEVVGAARFLLRHAVSDDLLHNRVLNHALCLQRAQRSTLTTTVYSPITPTALLASR